MSFLTSFLISFGLIFTAELGDKTQLMVFTLALRYGGWPVLSLPFRFCPAAPHSSAKAWASLYLLPS
jgi:putative Ca2+/H+ antiporter (TMEM165/GDT1 family)